MQPAISAEKHPPRMARLSAARLTNETMSIGERVTTKTAPGGGAAELAKLLNAAAVRKRCALVHDWVAAGRSQHFTLHPQRLAEVSAYVADVTRAAYPDLDIPPHSRWRHFTAGGINRWTSIARRLDGATANDRARAAIDLTTISVLLDAGAGDRWRYRERATEHFDAVYPPETAAASVDRSTNVNAS